MKAAICPSYGNPDAIQIAEIDKPSPKAGEVLVKVRAASVNPLDWHMKKGSSYLIRPMTGLRKPRNTRLGVDVAGQVEADGEGVTQFKPGDAVYGNCAGAFAEYVCAPVLKLASKPDSITFEQAAAVPVAGLTALQGLRDRAKIQPGQKVLINGASGGVGTFTVQIAKALGAEVTAVCSAKNAELVRSIGADNVINYARVDFTQGEVRYDVIFDLVASQSLSACRRVLNPEGVYLAVGALHERTLGAIMSRMAGALVTSWFVKQKLEMFIAKTNGADLNALNELMIAGKLKPVIDRTYKLGEVAGAIRYLESKRARGKLVVVLD